MTIYDYERNWNRISDVFDEVVLTQKEVETLRWVATWEPELVERMCRIVESVVDQRNGDVCEQD